LKFRALGTFGGRIREGRGGRGKEGERKGRGRRGKWEDGKRMN